MEFQICNWNLLWFLSVSNCFLHVQTTIRAWWRFECSFVLNWYWCTVKWEDHDFCTLSIKKDMISQQNRKGWFNLRWVTWVAESWSLPPPTLAQCRVTAFVYSKFQYKAWIHVTIHECCPEVTHSTWIFPEFNIYMNIGRVPPLFGTNMQLHFICNQIHVLLELWLDKSCNPKPWQKEVGHTLDEPTLQLRWLFGG